MIHPVPHYDCPTKTSVCLCEQWLGLLTVPERGR